MVNNAKFKRNVIIVSLIGVFILFWLIINNFIITYKLFFSKFEKDTKESIAALTEAMEALEEKNSELEENLNMFLFEETKARVSEIKNNKAQLISSLSGTKLENASTFYNHFESMTIDELEDYKIVHDLYEEFKEISK